MNAVSLFALTPRVEPQSATSKGDLYDLKDRPLTWVKIKSFLAMAQQLGKTLFHQGDLSYIEVHTSLSFLKVGREYGDITQCLGIL